MKEHLSDGQLRAALDGELDEAGLRHIAACAVCQARQQELRRRAASAERALAFLHPAEREQAPSVLSAVEEFRQRKLDQKENTVFKRLFASTAARAVALAVLALALIVAIPATRALADELLNLFRVQQVTVIPVDFSGLQSLNGDSALGKQISQLISGSMDVTEKPGEPVTVKDAAEAGQQAGFAVRLPKDMTPSRLSVEGSAAFKFTVDRNKAQAVLNEAGRQDLVLPQDIDGAVISVKVPASVQAAYGTCPDPSAADDTTGGPRGRSYPNCIMLAQIPSPTVNAPANVDVAQLAQIGLEFTGMSPEQAQAFTSTVDWTSTLVVPIPKNASTYKQLTVDGVTGTLIQRPADDAPQYVLLWVKNGIVYAIGGQGSNSQQAIDMANSLP